MMKQNKPVAAGWIRKYPLRIVALALCLTLFAAMGIQGTLAWLADNTEQVTNTFTPGEVEIEVEEEFDGDKKSNVNVTNTGNIDAFVRVRLLTYRINDQGNRIGGTATIPSFTMGSGWFKSGDYYYYSKPVAPNDSPDNALIGSEGIELKTYDDADGGKQVVEVIAEAIQAYGVDDNGEHPVEQAWGVTYDNKGTPDYADDIIKK